VEPIIFELANHLRQLVRGHLNLGGAGPSGQRLDVNSFYTEYNGWPWIPVMGEFHFSRYPHACWERELRKIKAGGVQVLATYVFWIHYEEEEGVFDFSGDRDLRRFVQLCGDCGLMVIARIGPFCHGEVRNGGLPDWLYGRPLEARSNDPRYLAYVKRLYDQIGQQLSGLMFKDGGPVVGVQCENEFMDSAAPWETTQQQAVEFTPKGRDGNQHMLELKRLAREAGLDAPLFVSTGWGSAPILASEFLPMFGGYAFYAWLDDPSQQEPTHNYVFRNMHGRPHKQFDTASVPFACCELGGGMQVFYRNRPVVPPASVEAMHVVYLGSGANLMGYYVYHGGSNPVGKHSFLNEHRCPRISYDFQAPLGEFGQTRDSYRRLKRQFMFLHEWGGQLAPMTTALPLANTATDARDTASIRCAIRADADGRGFLFLNNYQDHVELPARHAVDVQLRRADGGTVRFPAFDLPVNACAIFPFDLELPAGIVLRSATAQPLARVVDGAGSPHLLFFALPGQSPQYLFDASTCTAIEPMQASDGVLRVTVEPGLQSTIHLRSRAGDTVLLITLTDAQSLNCWKFSLDGVEAIAICDADVLQTPDGLELTGNAGAALDLWICPPPARPLRATAGVIEPTGQGSFARYRVALPAPKNLPISIDRPGRDQAIVRLPAGAADDLDELLLRIDYRGDVGSAFIDGRLVHDNFANGTPWEIGLKRFTRPDRDLEMFLRISPAKTTVQYTDMAAMKVANDLATEFVSITAHPRSRTTLRCG
jgi:beta-galactosidase